MIVGTRGASRYCVSKNGIHGTGQLDWHGDVYNFILWALNFFSRILFDFLCHRCHQETVNRGASVEDEEMLSELSKLQESAAFDAKDAGGDHEVIDTLVLRSRAKDKRQEPDQKENHISLLALWLDIDLIIRIHKWWLGCLLGICQQEEAALEKLTKEDPQKATIGLKHKIGRFDHNRFYLHSCFYSWPWPSMTYVGS